MGQVLGRGPASMDAAQRFHGQVASQIQTLTRRYPSSGSFKATAARADPWHPCHYAAMSELGANLLSALLQIFELMWEIFPPCYSRQQVL